MSVADSLEARIRQHIPLSAAMEFRIVELEPNLIRVTAPLEPNVNIHGTGFAGSIYSVGILTGWALATHMLDNSASDAQLVVARAEIRYRRPVTGPLESSCAVSNAQRDEFLEGLEAEGKGIIDLDIQIGRDPSAVIQGRFCAIA